MLKLLRKQKYKKGFIVFLCLLIVGNIIHLRVLCLGADGHVEVESAFHDCCSKQNHYIAIAEYNVFSSAEGHEVCEHFGPCIDIPITNDLLRTTKTEQEINIKSPTLTTCFIVDNDNYNSSEYHLVYKTFSDTSFYAPLRTIILLV